MSASDRAGGNPAAPRQGDESVFDGTSSMIPSGPWQEAPPSTSPFGDYECPDMSAVNGKADAATPMVFPMM